jgi:hypothetical protein
LRKTNKIRISYFFVFCQDKDGYITIKEFREYHEKTNKDPSAIEKAFAAIDSDKDGMVTFEGKI